MNIYKSGIYLIRNECNGKVYIGSASDLPERRRRHFGRLRTNRHVNRHLQSAWNHYGEQSFSFQVLLHCDRKNLLLFEQRTIDTFKNRHGIAVLYNVDYIAGSRMGTMVSDETRAKLSANNTRPFLGKKHSVETRARMSEAAKHRAADPEWVERMRKISIGRVDSPTTTERRRSSATGRPMSEDAKEKVRASKLGKPRSEEVKAKLRIVNTGKKQSRETIEKRTQKVKATWAKKKQAQESPE